THAYPFVPCGSTVNSQSADSVFRVSRTGASSRLLFAIALRPDSRSKNRESPHSTCIDTTSESRPEARTRSVPPWDTFTLEGGLLVIRPPYPAPDFRPGDRSPPLRAGPSTARAPAETPADSVPAICARHG